MRYPTYVATQLHLLEIIFSQKKKKKRARDFGKFICPMKHPRITKNTEMKAYYNHIKYYHQIQYIKLGGVSPCQNHEGI
jgi:hypothetical protein